MARIFFAISGLGGIVGGMEELLLLLFGIAMLVPSIFYLKQKPKYEIHLASAGGDLVALTSKDKTWIDRVVGALNESIIHRG